MGLERTIRFPADEAPGWERIRTQLCRVGETAALRMIDGMPAFPDEVPEALWKELRIGTSAGMVTIRRGRGMLSCVVWGNSDETLNVAWMKVIWACAAAGDGLIDTPGDSMTADQFAQTAGLSPA
jgi:hypothetical protein